MTLRLDMVGLVVADIARSVAFYRLLDVEVSEPDAARPYHETVLPSGIRLSWNAESMAKEIDPSWVPPVGQRTELAFLCASPAEVDAIHARVIAAGHASHHAPWDAPWGQRYAVVVDPDGAHVSLFAPSA